MKVIFAAGGTGGHINPALASAGELRRRHPDADILFIGTKEHMESKLVPAAGFAFKTIEITGFQRKFSAKNIAKNIKTLFLMISSSREVKKIIKEFKPDVVVGFGGYVSGPVVRTACNSFASGTANSAAADGVGARISATKSQIVKSVSCPTAEITGISEL